mgnify:CR=1 FL=1
MIGEIIFLILIIAIISTIITIILVKRAMNREKEEVKYIEKIDSLTVTLLYILSFFIPLAGFIVGAIYASKEEEHFKQVGKNCLIFSVLNIGIVFLMSFLFLSALF